MAITNKNSDDKLKRFSSRINGVARTARSALDTANATKKIVDEMKNIVDDLAEWKSNILYAESVEEKKAARQISNNPNTYIIKKLLIYVGALITIIAALLKVSLD